MNRQQTDEELEIDLRELFFVLHEKVHIHYVSFKKISVLHIHLCAEQAG